jgi:hypothetical protein
MQYKIIKIKSPKQENGIWGMPLRVTRIMGDPIPENEKLSLLSSAIIIAITQEHMCGSIQLNFAKNGFGVSIGDSMTSYFVNYSYYFLEDDNLYVFKNEWDRIVFERKKKVEEINGKV